MHMEEIFTAIAETEHIPRGAIVVGANEGTCLHILPEVFAQFKRNYPDVAVNIKRSDYAKILESVSDNSVDFGVVSLPVTDNRLDSRLVERPDRHGLFLRSGDGSDDLLEGDADA